MILISALWLVSATNCGYRFAGGGSFPGAVQSLFVDVLVNHSAETGIESILTNDLIYEITRAKKVVLTTLNRAEAILTGGIKAVTVETISYLGSMTSLERRVNITIDLQLKRPDGRIIWMAQDVSANEEYSVATDKLATEQNRRTAIILLSKRLAENVYHRLTEDF